MPVLRGGLRSAAVPAVQGPFKPRISRRVLVTMVVSLAGVIGVGPAGQAIQDRDFFFLGVWSVYMGIAFWLWLQLQEDNPPTPPSSAPFSPLSIKAHPQLWPRDSLVSNLLDYIDTPTRTSPIFLVGPSGVGKSIIVRRFLDDIDEYDQETFWDAHYVDPDAVLQRLQLISKRKTTGKPPLVVLDQFEHLVRRWPGSFKKEGGINETLDSLVIHHKVPVVIVCRSDRFYDLRVLEDLGPHPLNTIDVPSLAEDLDNKSDLLFEISRAFERCVDLSGTGLTTSEWVQSVLESQRALRPAVTTLELEMAAAAIIQTSDGSVIGPGAAKEMRDRDLCMRFLDYQLQGIGEKNIALKMLFALSIRDPSATPIAPIDLASAVFEQEEDCIGVLGQLDERRFINQSPSRLRHDALGGLCEQYCASRLDGWETRSIRSRLARDGDLRLHEQGRFASVERASKIMLVFTVGIGLARSVFPSWFVWSALSDGGSQVATTGGETSSAWYSKRIDDLFGLVAIVFGVWANYVFRLTTATFMRVRDNFINMLGMVAWVLVPGGMLMAALVTKFWMISVSVNGLWLALSFYLVSRHSPPSVRRHLLAYSFPTAMFMFAIAGLNMALHFFAFRRNLGTHEAVEMFQNWSLIFGLMMLILALLLTNLHTSTTFTSKVRGMILTDYKEIEA